MQIDILWEDERVASDGDVFDMRGDFEAGRMVIRRVLRYNTLRGMEADRGTAFYVLNLRFVAPAEPVLPAKGKERATIGFHGGYDSFVEEFYPFLEPLTNYGWTVLGFDGPGQGGALRQG